MRWWKQQVFFKEKKKKKIKKPYSSGPSWSLDFKEAKSTAGLKGGYEGAVKLLYVAIFSSYRPATELISDINYTHLSAAPLRLALPAPCCIPADGKYKFLFSLTDTGGREGPCLQQETLYTVVASSGKQNLLKKCPGVILLIKVV